MIEGMNNDELILFIYQEMLKILNQAVFFFEKNDIESRVNAINKGIEVVNALLSILNYEQGGDIAQRLRSLYLYSIKKLSTANFNKDPKLILEVTRIFKDLHSGWSQKIENDRKSRVSMPVKTSFGSAAQEAGGGSSGRLELYG